MLNPFGEENRKCTPTLSGNLYVDIEQRTPIARVFTPMGSFYLDQEGYVMPLSDKYTAQVIVVNGYLPIKI